MHSAAMSHPAGDVFMFGQGSNGQVGVHSTKSLFLPTDINPVNPPQTQMTDEVKIIHNIMLIFALYRFFYRSSGARPPNHLGLDFHIYICIHMYVRF